MMRILVVCLAISCAACGPLGPIPGGRLSGPVVDEARDWTQLARLESAQLETNPEDPHSVNTWFAVVDGDLYVPTSMILGPTDPSERRWVRNVGSNDAVRIRIGGSVYPRRAVRLESPAEIARVLDALRSKYAVEASARDSDRTVWIYRMEGR